MNADFKIRGRAARIILDYQRYDGSLAFIHPQDLAGVPIKALIDRLPKADWQALSDVPYGCANQAGEDTRKVARMASLLAGLSVEVPGAAINRLCRSSPDALRRAAHSIKSGEASIL